MAPENLLSDPSLTLLEAGFEGDIEGNEPEHDVWCQLQPLTFTRVIRIDVGLLPGTTFRRFKAAARCSWPRPTIANHEKART